MSRPSLPRLPSSEFGPFEGKRWINCAHQGPLPKAAVEAAREAIAWKMAPHHLTSERFDAVPRRLREALGRLLNVPAEDVILGNSASYGLHLLANGFPWKSGDEVLLVKGDFPSVTLPWLGLDRRGVKVRFLEGGDEGIQPEALLAAASERTRLFCTNWVHSFTGRAIDLEAFGEACRSRDVFFMINGAQAVGARPLDVATTPVDAVTGVGFKWLCGPYGTGYCWIRPPLRERLEINLNYWLAMQTADDLGRVEDRPETNRDIGARRYDVFGTANFFNFHSFRASVEYLLELGIEAIAAQDDALVERLVEGLDRDKYRLLSPDSVPDRSTLVLLSHRDPERNLEIHQTLWQNDICCSFRRGNIRFSPHLYNSEGDIDAALKVLNES